MYILGLNLLHDTSAALLSDGSIVDAVEEEWFTCVKYTDCTPRRCHSDFLFLRTRCNFYRQLFAYFSLAVTFASERGEVICWFFSLILSLWQLHRAPII